MGRKLEQFGLSPGPDGASRRESDRRDPAVAADAVAKADLWRLEDVFTRTLEQGFKGVHDRQNITNGRVNDAHEKLADHNRALKNLNAEVFGRPRREGAPAPAPVKADDSGVTQRDVRMFVAGIGSLTLVAGFFWKFLPFLLKALRP
jgi:hypothetical protein